MADDKVVGIFSQCMRELDDLPYEEQITILKMALKTVQDEMFRLQSENGELRKRLS